MMIAKDLGPSMPHFPRDKRAIVMGSYYEQYGGGSQGKKDYTLYVEGEGRSSWYHEHQLTLLQEDGKTLLKQWEQEAREEKHLHSDLDWIFSHGEAVLESASGYTVEALASKLGKKNLWGNNGEGITYYCNANVVMEVCKPFLLKGDKEGFLAFAKTA